MTHPAPLLLDARAELGEGPLFAHGHLFFFDILANRLHRVKADGTEATAWDLGERASAAAIAPEGRLLIATETALKLFDPQSGASTSLAPLEADAPATRSNDGRADRQGGFWIGTMGKAAEEGAGALYRYAEGKLHKLRDGMTIPNSICFSPDGRTAYFGDSRKKQIWRWPLDAAGMPLGEPVPFYAHSGPGGPDGAIVDAGGHLLAALWGGSGLLRISPEGVAGTHHPLPALQTSCPAAGPDGQVFVTSARQGMSPDAIAASPLSGAVFSIPAPAPLLPEPEIKLP